MFIAGAPELAVHPSAVLEGPHPTVTPADQHALNVRHCNPAHLRDRPALSCNLCSPETLHALGSLACASWWIALYELC